MGGVSAIRKARQFQLESSRCWANKHRMIDEANRANQLAMGGRKDRMRNRHLAAGTPSEARVDQGWRGNPRPWCRPASFDLCKKECSKRKCDKAKSPRNSDLGRSAFELPVRGTLSARSLCDGPISNEAGTLLYSPWQNSSSPDHSLGAAKNRSYSHQLMSATLRTACLAMKNRNPAASHQCWAYVPRPTNI